MDLRVRDLPHGLGRRLRRQRERDGFGKIVQPDDLDARVRAHHRHDARKGRDAAQHRGAAIDRGTEHQRRAQDHPIERKLFQISLGPRFAARKCRRPVRLGADRGNLDHALDAGAHAAVEQRLGAAELHALHVVAQAVLQHADAIDDRVDALQQRLPRLGARKLLEIRRDPLRVRQPAPRAAEISSGGNDIVTGGMQTRQACRADQAISAGDEHAHRVLKNKTCGRAGRAPRFAASGQKLDPAVIEVVACGQDLDFIVLDEM